MNFADKIQEIIFAHGRYMLRNDETDSRDEVPSGYRGIDSIEATDKIIQLIASLIIDSDDKVTAKSSNQEQSRNELREEQRLKLYKQKGERASLKD